MATTQDIELDDDIRQRLQQLANARNRTPQGLIQTAIIDYLEREETYEREKQEDQERWAKYQRTGKAIPHDAATQWLQSLALGQDAPCPE